MTTDELLRDLRTSRADLARLIETVMRDRLPYIVIPTQAVQAWRRGGAASLGGNRGMVGRPQRGPRSGMSRSALLPLYAHSVVQALSPRRLSFGHCLKKSVWAA